MYELSQLTLLTMPVNIAPVRALTAGSAVPGGPLPIHICFMLSPGASDDIKGKDED